METGKALKVTCLVSITVYSSSGLEDIYFFTKEKQNLLTLNKRSYKLNRTVIRRRSTPGEGHVGQLDRSSLVSNSGLPLAQAVEIPGDGRDGDKPADQGSIAIRTVLATSMQHEGVKILRSLQLN